AASLADHQMVDGADLLAIGGIDFRAFDLAGTDQEAAFIAFQRAAAVKFPPPFELLSGECEAVSECLVWLCHVVFLSFPDGGRDPAWMLVHAALAGEIRGGRRLERHRLYALAMGRTADRSGPDGGNIAVWSRLVVPGAAFRKSGPQIGLFGVPVEPAADIGAFGHDPETAGTGILDQRLDKLPGDSESAHLGRSVG